MIFRLTHKLNQKLKTGSLDHLALDQNPFADWSCRLFSADRRQYILLSNTSSLYSCVMPGKGTPDAETFVENALDCLRDFTADDAHQWAFRNFIAPARETVHFSKALNRSVTTSMNQLVEYAQDLLIDNRLPSHEVGYRLNEYLLSCIAATKSDGYGTPRDAFQRMVAAKQAEQET